MKPALTTLALLALPVAAALAQDAKPTEASIRRLFDLMHTSEVVDAVTSQVDTNMREALERATGGRQLNPQQQQLHDDMRAKIVAMLKEELDWSHLEPQAVGVYRSTFTPREIDAMLKFYGSPDGKAVVAKMPQATQQMMQLTQEHVRELVPRIVELQKETAQKIKDAAGPSPAAPAPAAPPSPQAPPPH